MTVIIIGDVGNDVLKIQKNLQQLDLHTIHVFQSAYTAIQYEHLFLDEEIRLIIYDANLNVNNYEANCREIEALKGWRDVPILLSTSYEKPVIFERLLDTGIFDFILKPFDFIQLKIRIRIALNYYEETKKRKAHELQLKTDLAIAKNVQKSALSQELMLPSIEVNGMYFTSQSLGGDMYCWFQLNDDLTAVLLFDVMGHGVSAALVTMSIRSLLKDIIVKLIDPVSVMKEMNRKIYELFSTDGLDSFLVTAIYVVIDTKNGTLQYVNASHPEGVMFGKYGETVMMHANSPILGLFPTIQVKAKSIRLTGWHRIILYTDGLFTLYPDQKIDWDFFHSYSSQNSRLMLRKFTEEYKLPHLPLEDDITVVSITTAL
ncbi:response regulator [Sporosarcina sp. P37]|uniref:PP2C family protein-serine/threonine phosphatase n=1 Tax=unclassified Sporosarcina TaxID=2647733 RepID=UPI0009BD7053|nr:MULTISPECIES: fused response regulator/phosphatase [unclassified Sporosarcina]ARD48879.1 response regulator [Sporosarcina sp. P33]ARK25377.1 response regulator [Sporosarcina sp. P37]PID19069.1 response regulator [Sporosarcina sp. P35]